MTCAFIFIPQHVFCIKHDNCGWYNQLFVIYRLLYPTLCHISVSITNSLSYIGWYNQFFVIYMDSGWSRNCVSMKYLIYSVMHNSRGLLPWTYEIAKWWSLAVPCGPLRSLVVPCGPLCSLVVPCDHLQYLAVISQTLLFWSNYT